MKAKFISILLVLSMLFIVGMPASYAVTGTGATPYVSQEVVSVNVGSTISVPFSYGTSAVTVETICSSLAASAEVVGTNLNIKGIQDGVCFITMRFNDGTSITIKVNVGKVDTEGDKNYYDISLKKGNYKNIYIDLEEYGARRATVSYSGNVISVNKTSFTYSGNLKVTGKNYGSTTIEVEYSTGDVDTYDIEVVSTTSSNYDSDEDIYLDDIDDTDTYYIDLDDYDADSARITYDDDYVEVNKTYFTSNGSLRITGIEEGTSEIKIKYDSGDTVYLTVYCGDYSDIYNTEEEDYSVSLNGTTSYYVDLDYYNADKATITYNSSYVSVTKTSFTRSGELRITAKKRGKSVVKVKYDSGDLVSLNINCGTSSNKTPYVSKTDIAVKKGSSATFYVYLERAEKATLSVDDTSVATVSKSSVTDNSSITVSGKKIGDTRIRVKFDDGTTEYITVEVTDSLGGTNVGLNAELESSVIEKDNATILKLQSNSSNTTAYVTLDNPRAVKLDIPNYTSSTKTYPISIGANASKEIAIVGLMNGTYTISVHFGNANAGYTYDLLLQVTDNIQESCEGVDSNGRNYRLNKGISLDSTVLANGYISGYTDGTFGPDLNISREEFGVMLARILESKDMLSSSDYINDVTADWSKDSIAELVAMGIVTNNGKYRPTDKITREEVAEMLYNAVDVSAFEDTCTLVDVYTTDLGKKIARCCNAGLISGYPNGTFGGSNYITRAEVVALLNRVFYKDNLTSKHNPFVDISESHWAFSSILKAANF